MVWSESDPRLAVVLRLLVGMERHFSLVGGLGYGSEVLQSNKGRGSGRGSRRCHMPRWQTCKGISLPQSSRKTNSVGLFSEHVRTVFLVTRMDRAWRVTSPLDPRIGQLVSTAALYQRQTRVLALS